MSKQLALDLMERIFTDVSALAELANRWAPDRDAQELDDAFDYASFLADVDYVKGYITNGEVD